MSSDRVKQHTERLLDTIEGYFDRRDWQEVSQLSKDVLFLDPENLDAKSYLSAAERALVSNQSRESQNRISELNLGTSDPSNATASNIGVKAEADHVSIARSPKDRPIGLRSVPNSQEIRSNPLTPGPISKKPYNTPSPPDAKAVIPSNQAPNQAIKSNPITPDSPSEINREKAIKSETDRAITGVIQNLDDTRNKLLKAAKDAGFTDEQLRPKKGAISYRRESSQAGVRVPRIPSPKQGENVAWNKSYPISSSTSAQNQKSIDQEKPSFTPKGNFCGLCGKSLQETDDPNCKECAPSLTEIEPNSPTKIPGDLIREGEQLLEEGKYEKSVEVLTQALSANANLSRAYLLRGQAYELLGNTQLALANKNSADLIISNRTPLPLRKEVWLRNFHIRRGLLGAFWILVGLAGLIGNIYMEVTSTEPGNDIRIALGFFFVMAFGGFKVIQGFFGWLREPK